MDSYFDPSHAEVSVEYRHLNVMSMDRLKPKTSKHGYRTKTHILYINLLD